MASSDRLPELTAGQRRRGVEESVYVRQQRAYYKAALKEGFITFEEFLNMPYVWRMRVEEALRAVPGVGKATAGKVMRELGIAPNRRVQGLGRNQRAALLAWSDGWLRTHAPLKRGAR